MMTNEQFIQFAVITGLVLLMFLPLRLGVYLLGLPLRRRENSRWFLHLLEMGLSTGRRAEEIFLSCAHAGDRSVEFLATPRTPFVIGMLHILWGMIGLTGALAVYLSASPFDVYAAFAVGLLIFWGGLTIWAGVQLARYRARGRELAIGLARLEILVVSVGVAVVAVLAISGQFASVELGLMLVGMLVGFIMPGIFIYLLTMPEVVAVCGRKGKQEPLLVTSLREMELVAALRRAPGLIEPRIVSLLAVGRELGDLQKVLPACRIGLDEVTAKARSGQNHFVFITFFVMPVSLVILPMLAISIMPRFEAIMTDMGKLGDGGVIFEWLMANIWLVVSVHGLVLLCLWGFILAFLAGPRLQEGFARIMPEMAARLTLALPWRRKRAQRDFSVSLALLLDAGLPEARAVELAAESTGNRIFQNRAGRVGADLANGVPLPEAVGQIDGSGEFQWRLTNAARAGQGFLSALHAWHEALNARAEQQEQTATQMAMTGLVFYNGAIVGLVMVGVFQFLTGILDVVALW